MVATVTSKCNLGRLITFLFSYPMFQLKNIRELTCLFIYVFILMSQSLADDQDGLEDFLKREYSLVKPYRGKLSLVAATLILANKINWYISLK